MAALGHLFQDVPVDQIDQAQRELIEELEGQAPDLCQRIDQTGKLPDEDRQEIVRLAKAFLTRRNSPEQRGE